MLSIKTERSRVSATTGSQKGLKHKSLPQELCWSHSASDPKLKRTRVPSAISQLDVSLCLLPFFSTDGTPCCDTQSPPSQLHGMRPPWRHRAFSQKGPGFSLGRGRVVCKFAVTRQQGLRELRSRRPTPIAGSAS